MALAFGCDDTQPVRIWGRRVRISRSGWPQTRSLLGDRGISAEAGRSHGGIRVAFDLSRGVDIPPSLRAHGEQSERTAW